MPQYKYQVPYDAKGNLQHYPNDLLPAAEWRDNEPFRASLTLVGVQSGRSAKYVLWRDEDGRQFPMFVTDLVDLLNRRGMSRGSSGLRLWVVRKRGANYGLALAPDELLDGNAEEAAKQ